MGDFTFTATHALSGRNWTWNLVGKHAMPSSCVVDGQPGRVTYVALILNVFMSMH